MFRDERTRWELAQEFRERAEKFVAVSDHAGLMKLFAEYSARVAMIDGEEGLEYMEGVLAEVFRQPLDRIKHDWFDHI